MRATFNFYKGFFPYQHLKSYFHIHTSNFYIFISTPKSFKFGKKTSVSCSLFSNCDVVTVHITPNINRIPASDLASLTLTLSLSHCLTHSLNLLYHSDSLHIQITLATINIRKFYQNDVAAFVWIKKRNVKLGQRKSIGVREGTKPLGLDLVRN